MASMDEYYLCYNNNNISSYYVHFPLGLFRYEYLPYMERVYRARNIKFDSVIKLGLFRSDVRELYPEGTNFCKHCNKVLVGHRLKQFCDSECKNLHRIKSRNGELEGKCVECGTTFKFGNGFRKYCSTKCQQKNSRRNSRLGLVSIERSYDIRKSREDRDKIKNCSVDCLLSEFGDIE